MSAVSSAGVNPRGVWVVARGALVARELRRWAPALACALVYGLVVVRTSWLSDDAYISLRMVDNLVSGRGWTWNPGERVLAGTNPLWMLLLVPFRAFTGEEYYSTLALCWLTCAAVLVGLVRLSAHPLNAALAFLALALSRSAVDYSTSGLENPLTWLLSLAFVAVSDRPERGPRDLFHLSLLCALAMINRWDSCLLFAPTLIGRLWRWRSLAAVGQGALGALPLILWLGFSLIYFGFPFPNTAYAKLGTGIDGGRLLEQGWYYYRWTAVRDPLTFALIIGAAVAALRGSPRVRPLVAGALLYLLYTLKIGGDFMGGRFFSTPMVFLIGAAVRQPPLGRRAFGVASLATLLLGLPFGGRAVFARFVSAEELTAAGTGRVKVLIDEGVADERLWHSSPHALFSEQRVVREQDTLEADQRPRVEARGMVGQSGFLGGDALHLLDVCALGDPLLARLPAAGFVELRVGHYFRVIPEGYVETLETGEDHFEDRALADYYRRLSLVTRGDLLDPARLMEIWRFNTGQNGADIDWEAYREPPVAQTTVRELRAARRQDGGTPFGPSGVIIDLGRRQRAERVEVELAAPYGYQVMFLLEDRVMGRAKVSAASGAPGSLVDLTVEPPDRASRGFDRILIRPAGIDNDQRFAVGEVAVTRDSSDQAVTDPAASERPAR